MDKQNNWEERFDESIFKQNNEGNPYFPDWEAVKSFIEKELQAQNQELLEKIEGILTPHGLVSDDPKIEKIIQDEKLKALEDIKKLIK